MRTFFALSLLLTIGLVAGPSFAEGLAVELKLAREVQDRKPVEPAASFAPGKVYCWNRLTGGEGEFSVTHVWSRDGKPVWKRSVRARGKQWVTWSFHNVTPGSWRVEVLDGAGKALASSEFTVK